MLSPVNYINYNALFAFVCVLPAELACFLNIFHVEKNIKNKQMRKAKAI